MNHHKLISRHNRQSRICSVSSVLKKPLSKNRRCPEFLGQSGVNGKTISSDDPKAIDKLEERLKYLNDLLGHCPGYKMTHLKANIARVKKRITELTYFSSIESSETIFKNIRLVLNTEARRVQLIFPHQPSINNIETLKHDFGFRKCSGQLKWQLFLTNENIQKAHRFLTQYEPD